MALTPVTIVGLLINSDGSLATGGFTFQCMLAGVPVTIQDSGTGEIVVPGPIAAQVNNGNILANGPNNPPLVLIANDDPTTIPADTYYLVTEDLVAGGEDPWQLVVHHNAPGGVENIATQRPTP